MPVPKIDASARPVMAVGTLRKMSVIRIRTCSTQPR